MKPFLSLGWLVIAFLMPASTLRAGETNHNFARWEREISAFERSDATKPPPMGACLFIGSSTVRFWTNLATDFPDQKVINRGFGGSEIVDATHFADRIVFPYAPRLIFLRAGGNDLANGKSVAEVFADFKDFVATVQSRLPGAEIIYISLSPTNARWKQHEQEKAVNTLIHDFIGDKPHLYYIEDYDIVLGPDGKPRADLLRKDKLHFNPDGYKLLAQRVREQWPAIK